MRLTAIDLSPDNALRVLNADSPLPLGQRDYTGDHDDQEHDHEYEHHRTHLAGAPLAGTNVFHAWTSAPGSAATMPTVMIIDIPLPMPRSVIWSPIHIKNIVPALSVMTVTIWKPSPGLVTKGSKSCGHRADALEEGIGGRVFHRNCQQIALEQTKRERRVPGVLHDLLPAASLLPRQLVQSRDQPPSATAS